MPCGLKCYVHSCNRVAKTPKSLLAALYHHVIIVDALIGVCTLGPLSVSVRIFLSKIIFLTMFEGRSSEQMEQSSITLVNNAMDGQSWQGLALGKAK